MTEENKLKLLIGTPAYNSMVHTDYMHSVLGFREKGLNISLMTLGNESLITRGRNTIISYFYTEESLSHLLFLDADVYLNADDLVKMLSYNVDVIGAAVALKGKDAFGNPVLNVHGVLGQDSNTGLLKVEKVGTAVFMLSRKAVNDLVDQAIRNGDIYDSNPLSRSGPGKGLPDIKMYDIFQVGVVGSEYLSEDYYVCNTLRNVLGYNVYVDPSIKTKHNGMYEF